MEAGDDRRLLVLALSLPLRKKRENKRRVVVVCESVCVCEMSVRVNECMGECAKESVWSGAIVNAQRTNSPHPLPPPHVHVYLCVYLGPSATRRRFR